MWEKRSKEVVLGEDQWETLKIGGYFKPFKYSFGSSIGHETVPLEKLTWIEWKRERPICCKIDSPEGF